MRSPRRSWWPTCSPKPTTGWPWWAVPARAGHLRRAGPAAAGGRGARVLQPPPSFGELVLVGPDGGRPAGPAPDPPGALRQLGRGRRRSPSSWSSQPSRAWPGCSRTTRTPGGDLRRRPGRRAQGRPVGHPAGRPAPGLDDLPLRRHHPGPGRRSRSWSGSIPFGLTIEPPEGAAVDSWERAARVVHQTYLISLGDQLDPTKPAQRPWAELSAVLPGLQRAAGHRHPGRRGVGRPHLGTDSGRPGDRLDRHPAGPAGADGPARARVVAAVLPGERLVLRGDPQRRQARAQRAGALGPALGPDYRERAIGNVKGRAEHPARPRLPVLDRQSTTVAWTGVPARRGARPRCWTADWRWQTRTGDWLQARAGDYQVRNGNGEAWSVEPEIFTAVYEHVARRPVAADRRGVRPARGAGGAGDLAGGPGDRRRGRLGDQGCRGGAVDHLGRALRGELRSAVGA